MSIGQRPSSRRRLEEIRRRIGADSEAVSAHPTAIESGIPKVRHRSVWALYGALYGLMRGHRGRMAGVLVGLTIGTLIKLIPPASTKVVIDYVLLDRPLPSGDSGLAADPGDAGEPAVGGGGGWSSGSP